MAIERPKLRLHRGTTYVFNVSDSSLSSHPLKFTNDSGTSEYTTGITTSGTSGTTGATVTFAVPNDAPSNLMYYCGTHGIGMGNKVKIIDDPTVLPFVNGGTRGFMMNGRQSPAVYNSVTQSLNVAYPYIQYFDTTTPGNASVFGQPHSWRGWQAGNMSNGTRALFAGGIGYYDQTNDIQYITCATTGNASVFGDCSTTTYGKAGASDGTKALISSGDGSSDRQIDYVTIDTLGNAQDFGDFTGYAHRNAGMSDGVKCVWNSTNSYAYEYVTAATLSNASTFGSAVTYRTEAPCAHANTTYGMTIGGESTNSTEISSIEYITIATVGNATDWGSNLPETRNENPGTGNSNTAFSMGGNRQTSTGQDADYYTNTIYAISMTTPGNNATDFGDLTGIRFNGAGNSGNAA